MNIPIVPPFGRDNVRKMKIPHRIVPESSPADKTKLYFDHHLNRRWRSRNSIRRREMSMYHISDLGAPRSYSRKINPTRNHEEKLIPVAGGIRMAPVRATGTLTYFIGVLGNRLVSVQVKMGRIAPARSQ